MCDDDTELNRLVFNKTLHLAEGTLVAINRYFLEAVGTAL